MMLKALLKKQFSELLYGYMKRGIAKPDEKGNGNKGKLLLFAALMLYVVGVFVVIFYKVMKELCPTLCAFGLQWLYFSLAGMLATALAIIGSIFLVQYQLYEAKDNDLLLSMPIPTSYVMFARLFALYVQNFLFEALVFVPSIVVYVQCGQAHMTAAIINCVLLLLLMPLFSLALTCVLGWLVALLSSRMRHRNLAVIVFSLAFIGGYFYVYSQYSVFLKKILENSEIIGQKVKTLFYPFYELGRAGTGRVDALVFFTLITAAVSALVFLLLKANFVKLATAKPNEKKAVYKEKTARVSSADRALLKREALHLAKSPVYLLNGALGSMAMVLGSIAIFWKRNGLLAFLPALFPEDPAYAGVAELVITLVVCFACSMNAITAPSISLEGKSIWIAQSLPVPAEKVLWAKLRLHLLVSVPAALLFAGVFAMLLDATGKMLALMFITPVLFTVFSGLVGLTCNLKMPNLKWNNEAYAIKQGFSVLMSIFIVIGMLCLLILAVRFLIDPLTAYDLLLIFNAVMVAVSLVLFQWIRTRGAKIFSTLS